MSSPIPRLISSIPPLAPPSRRRSLFQVLAALPHDGVGHQVLQTRWLGKRITDSYWHVTRARVWKEGTRGKAWGKLVWKGKLVSPKEEPIRGGLKYLWNTYSRTPLPQPQSPRPQTAASAGPAGEAAAPPPPAPPSEAAQAESVV